MDIEELPKGYKIKRRMKPKTIFILLLLLILTLVMGTTYALWQIKLQQTDTNKLTAGCLDLKLQNNTSGIKLTNAVPMTDVEGLKLTPYTFTITNTCNNNTRYTINLENVTVEGEKLLPERYIKASLKADWTDSSEETLNRIGGSSSQDEAVSGGEDVDEEGTSEADPTFFDTLKDEYLTEAKAIPTSRRAYKLANGIIGANQSITYNLNLWMDIETPVIDAVMNASFESKITIVAENIISEETPSNIPTAWQDNGIFKDYYEQAYQKVQEMTLEEKIGQLMVVRYTSSAINDAITNYHVSGTTFYAVDFNGKTEAQVQEMTSSLQTTTKIPLITAVDEEGGKVVRVSSNSNLVAEPFKASKELYDTGGLPLIESDTKTKSAILKNLGLNMNFAPVVDIADSTAYIYARTLGQSPEITGQYAATVVQASKGTGVSYSLKHFPGYGNNADTHGTSSTDETSLEELQTKHLVPFKMGIEAKAEAVMISHNIVAAVDKEYPASLSKPVHDILFNDLKFTGIAITDDLDMDAAKDIPNNYTKAILAGNHIILCSNYQAAQKDILASINEGTLTEEQITKLAFKVIAWKYSKGLFE